MAWAVRNLTMLESHMMSVMRVRELTDLEETDVQDEAGSEQKSMPREYTEAGEALKAHFPDDINLNVTMAPLNEVALKADGWPWYGGVRFRNVSMRYNPSSPLVLKKMSINIPPGSTLGKYRRSRLTRNTLYHSDP
jgi:ABC-type multidrug transport system fused ATPase/permease subunit